MNIPTGAQDVVISFFKQVTGVVLLATLASSAADAQQFRSIKNPHTGKSSVVRNESEKTVASNQPASNPNGPSAPAVVMPQRIISKFVNNDSLVTTTSESADYLTTAESAFKNANYDKAAVAIELAILGDQDNGHMMLLATLIFIANKDYTTAAVYLDQATRILPPKDWYFVIRNEHRLYGSDGMANHLQEVAEFSKNNPVALDAHLIHAFFTGLGGQRSAVMKQLGQIQNIWPVSPFAQRLSNAFAATVSTNHQAK